MDEWVTLYDACSDYVVFLLLTRSGELFHAYTRFIHWGVSNSTVSVPLFLNNNPIRFFWGGGGRNVYRERQVCIIVTRVAGVVWV